MQVRTTNTPSGVIPGGYDFTPSNPQLAQVDTFLTDARRTLGLEDEATLPVAVGFILAHASAVPHFAETAIPLLLRHRAAGGAWLFAPDPDRDAAATYAALIPALHAAGLRAIVQVGTVAAAREALRAGADVLVAQGSDAGGHQFAKGAGVVSLVPEVRALLEAEGKTDDVALVAAGGIVDGQGVAAALALGELFVRGC